MSEENFDNLDVYYGKPENALKKCNCGGDKFKRVDNSSFGECIKCGKTSHSAVYPEERCVICRCRTYWSRTKDERWVCSKHWNRIPFNLMCSSSKTRFKKSQSIFVNSDWDIQAIYKNENGNGRKVLLIERFIKLDLIG